MEEELYRLSEVEIKKSIIGNLYKYLSKEVFDFIIENSNLERNYHIIDSESTFNIEIIDSGLESIINIHMINDIRRVNKYFQAVNEKLVNGGILVGCVEVYSQRRKRILSKHHPIISYPYYGLNFIVYRVLPKLKITQGFYFWLTKGLHRAISRAEAYGRLYSCGFKFICEREINNIMYFAFKKVSKPKYDTEPTYGPFIKLKRVGKGGKIVNVRKFRTMYAYSEFLQEFIYEQNDLALGGKFKDDPRISSYGKIIRKLWIDELPMLWNVLKGQMNIVGVRPLSKHYYSLYDEGLQLRRLNYKPGLVPPFYFDLPKTLREIQDSEIRYMDSYDRKPIRTQWKYFWVAMYNIIVKRARSA